MTKSSPEQVRLDAREPVVKSLFARSGNLCMFEGCDRPLFYSDGTQDVEIAHIHGVGKGSARWLPELDSETLRSEENLLLLCKRHHNKIDGNISRRSFSAERLNAMKATHVARMQTIDDRLRDLAADSPGRLPKNYQKLHAAHGGSLPVGEIQFLEDLLGELHSRLANVTPLARRLLGIVYRYLKPNETTMFLGELEARSGSRDLRPLIEMLERERLLYLDEEEDTPGLYFVQVPRSDRDAIETLRLFAHVHAMGLHDLLSDIDWTVMDI